MLLQRVADGILLSIVDDADAKDQKTDQGQCEGIDQRVFEHRAGEVIEIEGHTKHITKKSTT